MPHVSVLFNERLRELGGFRMSLINENQVPMVGKSGKQNLMKRFSFISFISD